MKIQYTLNEKLPPLAWAAYVIDGLVKVFHGEKVECFDDCFFEGAWDGAFNDKGFLNAEWFCGTGAKINGGKIAFSTPTPVTYSLCSTKVGGGTGLATA